MTETTAENRHKLSAEISPPDAVRDILGAITDAGYEAFLVGGCVRDWLLGRLPHDYDVTTSASPEQISGLFPRVIATGEGFGGVTVVTEGVCAEVTSYRTERGYRDGRHPYGVERAASLAEDMRRRDFTIGAIAWSPATGLVDCVGGFADLAAGLIRAVGEPEARFSEDHLRIIRGVRLAAELGFAIEPETLSAIRRCAGSLATVSRERLGAETERILRSPAPDMLGIIADTGALEYLGIPAGLAWGRLCACPEEARFAGLCMLCGSPPGELARELRRPNAEAALAGELCALAKTPPPGAAEDCKRLLSRHAAGRIRLALALREALAGGSAAAAVALLDEVCAGGEPCTLSALAVRGGDLLEAGIAPSRVGAALIELLEAVIEDPKLNTKEQLLRLL